MKTFRIEHPPTQTDYMTTDFMDVWNELEKVPDGEGVTITVQEMTSKEFEDVVRERGILKLSISTPWKKDESD